MRRRILAVGATLVALVALVTGPAAVGGANPQLLEVQSMTGLPKAYTGSQLPVRGLNGGGFPWVVDMAKAELSSGGFLELRVRHLVIDPNDPAAIGKGLAGSNPSPTFRAVVSCLTVAGGTMNVMSDPFPATTGVGGGSGTIETQLALPSPCLAPILFVTSPAGAWFATTGG
jgi:hypothetical protein